MKKCMMCQKELSNPKHKFCNWSCGTRFRNLSKGKHPVTKKCLVCDKKFEVKNYQKDTAKFCSNLCRMAHSKRNNKIVPCSQCGNPIELNWYRKKSGKRKNKSGRFFCTIKCRDLYKAKTEVTCSGCGKKFLAYKSRQSYYRKLYCTWDCYKKNGLMPSTKGYISNERYEKVRHRLMNHVRYLK